MVKDKRKILSALWLFATLNYLYCDIMGVMDSHLLNQYVTGTVNGVKMTENFLLGAAVLMEIPMGMILFSCILNYKFNRWANISSGIIMTLVQTVTLFAGTPRHYYLFCSSLEIATTLFIVGYAWNWKNASN